MLVLLLGEQAIEPKLLRCDWYQTFGELETLQADVICKINLGCVSWVGQKVSLVNLDHQILWRGWLVRIEATWVGDGYRCALWAGSTWSTLSRRLLSNAYAEQNVPEIIDTVLARYQHIGDEILPLFQLSGHYPSLPVVCQHQESDADFLVRLLRRHGVLLYTEHSQEESRPSITDDWNIRCWPHHDLVQGCPLVLEPACWDVSTIKRAVRASTLHTVSYHDPAVGWCFPESLDGTLHDQIISYLVVDRQHAKQVYRRQQAYDDAGREQLRFSSNDGSLRLGDTVTLDSTALGEHINGKCRITQLRHCYRSNGSRLMGLYSNMAWAIPSSNDVALDIDGGKKLCQDFHRGVVVGSTAKAGCFRVRLFEDFTRETPSEVDLWQLLPVAGETEGLYGPLQPNTQVMVGYVEADIDRPVIMAVLPHAQDALVRHSNRDQHLIVSDEGHAWVMDDNLGSIKMSLRDDQCLVQLQEGGEPGMTWYAKEAIRWAAYDVCIQVENEHSVLIKAGDYLQQQEMLTLYTDKCELFGGQSISIQAGQNLRLEAKQTNYQASHVEWTAKEDLNYNSAILQAVSHDVRVQAQQSLELSGSVELEVGPSCLAIKPDGQLVCHAPQVQFIASHLRLSMPWLRVNELGGHDL